MFERENVDLAMFLQMKDTDYMDMFKDLGISAWGDRFKIKQAVRNSMVVDTSVNGDTKRYKYFRLPTLQKQHTT